MIKITIIRDSDHRCKEFQLSGHAGHSEYGTDIVCASVSVLAINTINAIDSFTKDKFFIRQDEEAGLIDVRFESAISKETKLLMDTLILGLTNIEEEYGADYIKVIFKEV